MGWKTFPVQYGERPHSLYKDSSYPGAGIELLPGPRQFYEARIRELEEAVRGRFLLDFPRKGGSSLRATLETVERTTGIHDEQLDITEIPVGFESWYTHFLSLRTGERITYTDVIAYQEVTGMHLNPMELAAVMAMDRAASSAVAEVLKENANGG